MQSVRCLDHSEWSGSRIRRTATVPLLTVVALLLCAFAAPLAKALPSATPQITYTTNGHVKATARSGNDLYIGGTFTEVAPRTGPAAAIDSTTGELVSTPQVSGNGGEVRVVEPDGEGGYYVGGRFDWAGGEHHQGIVHVKADGSVDPTFAPQVSEFVYAMARQGSTLYIAGRFFGINGEARRSVAALDAETGELLPWAPELDPGPFGNPEVFAIATVGEYVYFGGKFGEVDGETRYRLAAVKAGGTGKEAADVSGWNPFPNGEVRALTVSGSTLYVGGGFTQLIEEGEAERKYLAAFDLSAGTPGEPEMTSWSPSASNTVYSVAASEDGERIYVGGNFTSFNGESRKYLVAVDSAGNLTEWNPAVNSQVRGIAVSGSTVYVAGYFRTVDGEPRMGLAALEASGEGALDGWDPRLVGDDTESVAVSGSNVLVGGLFSGVNGETRKYLAAIDLTNGDATSWAPEPNQEVFALAANESTVYASGVFTTIGGASRYRFGAVSAETGEATAFDAEANQYPAAMLLEGETLWVGGGFTTIGGKSRSHLAALDATTGEASEFNPPSINNDVKALAATGETIYVGGLFSEIGGAPHGHLAALDKSTGEVSAWNPELSSAVYAVTMDGSTVYAGGDFFKAGSETRNHLAAFDAETGELTSWNPNADGTVKAIQVGGPVTYVGGMFYNVGGERRGDLAAVDTSTGALLPWNPADNGASAEVETLQLDGSSLYVGGNIRSFEYGYQTGIGIFTEPTLTVATAGPGSGTVTSNPAGIECGSTCSSGYSTGEEVTLSAEPAAGSEFAGWSGGGCSGTGPCVVTVNADTTVTATFTAAVGPEGGGEGSGGAKGAGGEASGGGAAGSSEGKSGAGGTGSSAAEASGAAGASPSASGGAWINTKIAAARIGQPGRGVAGFWFATRGTEAASRFQCSLIKWPTGRNVRKRLKRIKVRFKACGPRKHVYRHLKPGRYTFRVRAIGTTVWDRKAAKRQFRIH